MKLEENRRILDYYKSNADTNKVLKGELEKEFEELNKFKIFILDGEKPKDCTDGPVSPFSLFGPMSGYGSGKADHIDFFYFYIHLNSLSCSNYSESFQWLDFKETILDGLKKLLKSLNGESVIQFACDYSINYSKDGKYRIDTIKNMLRLESYVPYFTIAFINQKAKRIFADVEQFKNWLNVEYFTFSKNFGAFLDKEGASGKEIDEIRKGLVEFGKEIDSIVSTF